MNFDPGLDVDSNELAGLEACGLHSRSTVPAAGTKVEVFFPNKDTGFILKMKIIVSVYLILPRFLHSQTNHVLTPSEALRALRPFYMAVHPDLFSQFPREKAANEESLKRLNSYLDALENQDHVIHNTQRRPQPINLIFFIHPKATRLTNPSKV